MPKFFDIHSHLNLPDFKSDVSEAVERMRQSETWTIVVGTNLRSSEKAVTLANEYPEIYACVGVHPTDGHTAKFDRGKFDALARHGKVVAVGECGFDFFHKDRSHDYDRQRELFLAQIDFATAHELPLMIHTRDSYPETLEVLEYAKDKHGDDLRGNVHFFSGDVRTADRFLALGFTLSFTGVITFARDYDEIIRHVSLERIMSETDAPWVAPAPYRGKRNEPSYVSEVVKKIAEIRGENLETVKKALLQNVSRVFGIPA